jgi:choice-of-anchor B domain-containing protein
MKKYVVLLFLSAWILSCSRDTPPVITLDDDVVMDDDIDPDPSEPVAQRCVNGMAGIYPCNGYDLVAHVDIDELGGSGARANDCWGWTDPMTQKEYALIGTSTGTAFVDLSDPLNLVIIGRLPSQTFNSIWRDIKTYGNYALIISEAPGHGMQVFDLTRLRDADPSNGIIEFSPDAHYNGFGRAHNIVINEANAYAYVVGSATYSGGPHFVDISDPLNPVLAGGYSADSYSHDAQVVTYNGPDADYTGREILVGSNENEVVIVDVTDKNNPMNISSISYPFIGYTHQGWFTDDFRYFIVGDEIDERDFGINSRTLVFDFTDLDNPTFHLNYLGPTAAIDHNGYVKGNSFFLANYTAGVRIIDISTIDNFFLTEEGFFDTYPDNDNTSFDGVWNVYPFFESGNILVNDINSGLFLIRKSEL